MKQTTVNVRKLTVIGMCSAVAFILMFLEFSIPFIIPGFIKMDFSEVPALICTFAMGPVAGAAVCVVKNLLHLLITTTGGVGELSNMILGVLFVVPAGIIYNCKKTMKMGVIGAVVGAVCMGLISNVTNYYVTYPFYTTVFFAGNAEGVLELYKILNANVETLWDALLWFNMPFTMAKGLFCVLITAFIYKPLSPIIKGKSGLKNKK